MLVHLAAQKHELRFHNVGATKTFLLMIFLSGGRKLSQYRLNKSVALSSVQSPFTSEISCMGSILAADSLH
jgi:hypothetical protein